MKEIYNEVIEARYELDTLRGRLNYLKRNSKSTILIDCALHAVDNIEKSLYNIKCVLEGEDDERYVL